MARPRKNRVIGAAPHPAHEAALRRALAPMIMQIRATLPKVQTLRDVSALAASIRRAWPDSKIRRIVLDVGQRAEVSASRPWQALRVRNDAAEYDADELLNAWSREATKRITSVRDEVAERLRTDVVAAVKAGIDHETLAQQWLSGGVPTLYGTAEGRVRVIAQNQLSILHANVQRTRAEAIGVKEFIWRTQGDDRVRLEHRMLEGRALSYRDPGGEGLPGHPVGCRCWAESVIPDDLDLVGVSTIIE